MCANANLRGVVATFPIPHQPATPHDRNTYSCSRRLARAEPGAFRGWSSMASLESAPSHKAR
eukprot:6838580-Prymnesium_polylepis.1